MDDADKSPEGEGSAGTDGSDSNIAPRPRPGYRTPKAQVDPYEKARLFAGMLRAALGCVGFFASLLYLPIQMATPILSGVSLLMMVTGSTSVWRAVREAPSLKMLPRAVALLCLAVAALTVVLTLVLGAGALGPLHGLKQEMRDAQRDDGAVRFEVAP